ncbi:MAG TPA: hypothetical protein DIC52_07000 [Candidatus Latescibacteria bacterium]|nr:hypothetical protein [Candidatus Latescibacterota bacterium]
MRLSVLLLALLWAMPGFSQITLVPGERDGQPVYVFENKYIRSEIAYTRARSPLTYFDKITGVEQLRQLAPLSGNHGQHVGHGGVSESVPWTGGSPYMGYLWTQPWEMTSRTYDDHAVLVGEITFPYPDPVTGRLCELRFEKTMTAYEGSTRLRMDYKIENVGERRARFQHCVHGSPCVGGTCDDGDYFYAPGDSSWVVWSGLLPQYEIPDQSWHDWPIPEAVDFRRTETDEGLQLFVPAPWGVIGDDKTQEVMAMVGSKVVIGGEREIPMYMGLTKSGDRYYLEPSLTRHISNHADRWEREGYSVDLDRGEAAVYTVDLAMFHGVSKKQITSVHALLGDYLLLDEPSLVYRADKAVIEIDIAVSGDAQLVVEDTATGKVLWSTDLVPGSVMRIAEDVALTAKEAEVTVLLKNAAGKQVLVGGGTGS